MATFGISFPDMLQEKLDRVAAQWYSNRSQALVRIFLEWEAAQARQEELPNLEEDLSEAKRFRQAGAAELPNLDQAA